MARRSCAMVAPAIPGWCSATCISAALTTSSSLAAMRRLPQAHVSVQTTPQACTPRLYRRSTGPVAQSENHAYHGVGGGGRQDEGSAVRAAERRDRGRAGRLPAARSPGPAAVRLPRDQPLARGHAGRTGGRALAVRGATATG